MALRPASRIPGVDDRPTRSRRCPAIAHGAPSRESALNLSSPARAQKFVDRHHPASSVRPLQLRPPNWSMMTRPPWVDWTEYVAAQDTSDSVDDITVGHIPNRSEEHTSELQSPDHLVCRLLLEKKKKRKNSYITADH